MATAGDGSLYPYVFRGRLGTFWSISMALSRHGYTGRPPPPGRLENSELAANSRKKEYSVSLPLCLAGFLLIKGGVGGGVRGGQ
jgi:hypothetical protein